MLHSENSKSSAAAAARRSAAEAGTAPAPVSIPAVAAAVPAAAPYRQNVRRANEPEPCWAGCWRSIGSAPIRGLGGRAGGDATAGRHGGATVQAAAEIGCAM